MKRKNPNHHYIRYESIAEFFRAGPKPGTRNDEIWKNEINKFGSDKRAWYGVDTQSQIDNLQKDGWPEGIRKLKTFSKKVKLQLPPIRRTRKVKVWGNNGGFCDLGQIMKGRTQTAWVRADRKSGPKMKGKASVIPVIIQVGGLSFVKPESLFWGPAAGLVLCDYLQALGYSIEISALDLTNNLDRSVLGSKYDMRIIVKQSHLSTSLKSLSVIACPAFFRWYGFKAMAAAPFNIATLFGQTGIYNGLNDRRDKIPPIVITSIYNEKTAVTFLNHCIQDFVNEED